LIVDEGLWLWSFLYGNGSVVYDNDDLNGWFWKRLGMDWIEGFVVIELNVVVLLFQILDWAMVLNDRRIVVVIIEVGRCKVEDDGEFWLIYLRIELYDLNVIYEWMKNFLSDFDLV
jgi:hypothetical protein